MAIRIKDQKPDVVVTESELRRYRDEYQKAFMFYSGTPPTLEEFIRRQQKPLKDRMQVFNG
jgi:L-amino acid N-acyltransferase YncA